jgi:hypothetical protein
MMIEISNGELIDKYTILEIKEEHITDSSKLYNIKKEKFIIQKELEHMNYFNKFSTEIAELKDINSQLWKIEDDIRIKESRLEFDEEFIELARSVYKTNDRRFAVKNRINTLSNSNIKEEKSYS